MAAQENIIEPAAIDVSEEVNHLKQRSEHLRGTNPVVAARMYIVAEMLSSASNDDRWRSWVKSATNAASR